MKTLRTFLVLLLCAMLPLSGLAASGVTGQCPMHATVMDDVVSASTDMAGCESMTSLPNSEGKSKISLCKVTAQCQMGSLYHPVSTPSVARPAGSFSPIRFHYAESLSIRAPDGLWRPPRTL
ncbi:hypothetical protein [Pararobbsia alpina]|uniref:Lipoprotein n=1 Tax=Pararobbsia alpina TaxID=621374 RepID=A0A6S7B3E7_9BURK|nr:hypothetical protein [Pararobbsia alpina]CAB3786393.1 hypothetical protein LMG28138_02213 [Pararobbsia alpina]